MKIKAWGPALALLGLILIAGIGLFSQQFKPNNHAQPPKAEEQHSRASNTASKPHAEEDDAEGDEEGRWYDTFLEHTPDWFVALFTLLLTFVTWRLVVSTNKLWAAGERQMELIAANSAQQSRDMKASIAAAEEANRVSRESVTATRRAWLSVEDVKLVPPTQFMEDGFTFKASATIKNLGQTPALAVWVDFQTLYLENGETYVTAKDRIMTKARQHPFGGHTIFPQDTLIQTELFADAKETIIKSISIRPDGQRNFGLMLFVTVSYKIVGDEGRHITHHVHDLLNVPVGSMVPHGQSIGLPAHPFLAGEID